MGAKKFGKSLEAREIKLFWRDIPVFCWDIPGAPEKFEKEKSVFKFWPLVDPAQVGLCKFGCGFGAY